MTEGVATKTRGRGLQIAVWVVSTLLTVLYAVVAGLPKVLGQQQVVEGFARYGFSDAFRLFICAAEICGGIGLWIPRLEFWAASGLIIIMIGAIYTTLSHGENPIPPLVAALLLGFVLWARRDRALFLS